jgi:hypothetical protein
MKKGVIFVTENLTNKEMKAYRYNAKKREDRKFNNCGKEKNPNSIRFYATNMTYADTYKYIYENGEIVDECTLEVVKINNVNLFDMEENFSTLNTYKKYISTEISIQKRDYTNFMNNSKTAKSRKMWEKAIENLIHRENELVNNLKANEFQQLSDFETQNDLVLELKSLGFDGYYTINEIALF